MKKFTDLKTWNFKFENSKTLETLVSFFKKQHDKDVIIWYILYRFTRPPDISNLIHAAPSNGVGSESITSFWKTILWELLDNLLNGKQKLYYREICTMVGHTMR